MEDLKAKLVRAFEGIQGYKGLEHERMADAVLAVSEIDAGLKLLSVEVALGEYDMSSAFRSPSHAPNA